MSALVLDNTCLSHFARAGQLAVLEAVTSAYTRLTTNEVMIEVHNGIGAHPVLGQLIGLRWLAIVELDIAETVRFAGFRAELGGDLTRDIGECTVLAAAESRSAVAVVDDRDAAALGRRHGIAVRGTLAVIGSALKRAVIDRATAESVVDELAATDMRLPVDGAGLVAWYYEHGVLP